MLFLLILFIFPSIAFAWGLIGQMLLKNMLMVVGLTFTISMVAMITVFNTTFFIWVVIYSLLSFVGALLLHLKQKSHSTS